MTIFITQGRFTQKALAGLVAKPEDRALAVAKLGKAAGLKLRDYYVTFGETDFLVIFEGPDPQQMASMMIAAAAAGGVTDVKTTVAMTSADAKKVFQTAGELTKSYRPAGA
jgi:uncharacterized protein with GYD domain